MISIGEALSRFDDAWVATQSVTPRTAYRRTLRLVGMYFETAGVSLDEPLERLGPDDLRAFVRWHRANGLADDDEGSRKVAVHVARLGAFLGEIAQRPELALGRDALRAEVGRSDVGSGADTDR